MLPGSFRNDWDRKALLWLQQTKEAHASLLDDPFMQSLHKLTLKSGAANSHDIELLTKMVDEYHARGQFYDAVLLWMTTGDRAASETTSFRERCGFTAQSYGNRLAQLLRDAGFERRAQLVENMLAVMTKPDGLHL